MPADRRPQRVRCAHCLDVVSTSNPWEVVTCRCGAVAVSGLPWRPRVDWVASVPGGWSFVEERPHEDDTGGEDAIDDVASATP